MDPCTHLLNTLRALRRLKPIKRLGQHMLRDCRVGYRFSEELRRLKPSGVMEFGMGAGQLTPFLADSAPYVVGVEIDARMLTHLRRVMEGRTNIYPIIGDGLAFIEGEAVRADVLVSNTPYVLSGPLLISFVKSRYRAALLMLQREVAEKLTSPPGVREYGRLSAFVQTFAFPEIVEIYPPSVFTPSPEVDSALVKIVRRREWREGFRKYEDFVTCLFTQRRKKASKILVKCLEKVLGVKDCGELVEGTEDKRVFNLDADYLFQLFSRAADLPHRA